MEDKIPKYEYVKNKILEDIKAGLIVDKLPGERVLAEDLGVSYMTVRKAVEDLVEDGVLHKLTTKGTYLSQRKMTPKITHNIGFFLDEEIKDGISSPYFSLVFNALEKEVKIRNYNLVFFSNFDDLNPLKNKKKIDGGIICCFPRIENKIQELKKLIPIILTDNNSFDKSIPSVTIDNFNGVVDSIDYLWSLGHKRIGFISGMLDSNACNARLNGYIGALNSHGLSEDKELIYKGDYSYESGEEGAKHLMSIAKPPTAIMCANDSMAIGAMKAIHENRLNIPDDISVVGFDDINVATQVFPPLTTVKAPIKEIAANSVDMLVSIINGKDLDYRHTILPTQLIIRSSCAGVKK